MYQDIKNLIPRDHKKIANNTYLTLSYLGEPATQLGHHIGEHIDMHLHGNLVARFYLDHIQLYSAGWYTTTTKDRLNLALELAKTNPVTYNGYLSWWEIYQVDYQWYYGNYHKGDPKFVDGMHINYHGVVLKTVIKEA